MCTQLVWGAAPRWLQVKYMRSLLVAFTAYDVYYVFADDSVGC